MKSCIKYTGILLLSLFCCCRQEMPTEDGPLGERVIPYTVTVQKEPVSRASLDGDTHYVFETGDKLFIQNSDGSFYGALEITSGVGETSAIFSGSMICEGDFQPEDDTNLSATLVSTTDRIHTYQSGKITGTTYPENEYASTFADAVSKYSDFTANNATYGAKTFSLSQQSSFLIFKLSIDGDGLTNSDELSAVLKNGETTLRNATVQPTVTDGVAEVNFIAAFKGGETTLSSASITIHGNNFSINGSTLDANTYYTVTRASVFYGNVVLTLPHTSNYTSGQAFPVNVARDPSAVEKHKLTKVTVVVQTPNGSEVTQNVSMEELLAQGSVDLDDDNLLTNILAEEGVQSLPTGDYVFYLKNTYDDVEHTESTSATMTILESNFYNIEKWAFTVGSLPTENDYVEVKMTTNNTEKRLQNIVGFGVTIEGSWNELDGAMFYYPISLNGTWLRLQGRHLGADAISKIDKEFVSPGERSLVLRFSRQGIFWNNANNADEDFCVSLSNRDTYMDNMASWCGSTELKIGSSEGVNRSYAHYDYIRVVRYP